MLNSFDVEIGLLRRPRKNINYTDIQVRRVDSMPSLTWLIERAPYKMSTFFSAVKVIF